MKKMRIKSGRIVEKILVSYDKKTRLWKNLKVILIPEHNRNNLSTRYVLPLIRINLLLYRINHIAGGGVCLIFI